MENANPQGETNTASGAETTQTQLTQTEWNQLKNKRVVIVFYGISGIGKTTLCNIFDDRCKELGITFSRLSRDPVAERNMKAYRLEHPEADLEDTFFAVRTKSRAEFKEEVFATIQSEHTGNSLVFLDQCTMDAPFFAELKRILNQQNEDSGTRLYAFHAEDLYKFQIKEGLSIPFSTQFIFNLCWRALTRGPHETMNYDDLKLIQITLSFMLVFKDTESYEASFQGDVDYHEMVKVDFYKEKTPDYLGEEAVKKLEDFERVVREGLRSIRTPFETLKGKEGGWPELEAVVDFVKDEGNLEVLSGAISFGSKDNWIALVDRIVEECFEGLIQE